jgi:predicted dinucleotide-binding enzyme
MEIGIIGAGQVGKALAKKLVNAGYSIVISNSRGPETLKSLVDELGKLARAGVGQPRSSYVGFRSNRCPRSKQR